MRALTGVVFVLALGLHATHADTPAGPPKPATPAATKPAPPPEKPVAKMTRAELEAEVTALRADNKKLRADNEARAKRLQATIGQPASELK